MAARAMIVTCCLLAALAAISRGGRDAVPLVIPLETLPWAVSGFKGQPAPDLDRAVVAELGVDEYVSRVYGSSDGAMLGLYVGYYESQRQGRSIHSPLNCLPGAGWEPVSMTRLDVAMPGQPAMEVNRYVVRKGLERLLILYWYQGRGRVTASEYAAKAFVVADAFRAGRTDGALVRIVAPLSESDELDDRRAEQRAVTFVRAMFPVLSRHLPA